MNITYTSLLIESFFVIILLVLSLNLVQIPESYACSCAQPVDYFLALSESEYSFTGTVTHIDNSDGPQKIHFDVISVAKGDIPDGVFVLSNNNLIRNGEFTTHSSCDVGYKTGVTYNVFVYDNINMNNGMCTTKDVGFLWILNPYEYNLFYYGVLGAIGFVIAGFVVWKKRK